VVGGGPQLVGRSAGVDRDQQELGEIGKRKGLVGTMSEVHPCAVAAFPCSVSNYVVVPSASLPKKEAYELT
jgi:hypothetical protein